MLAWLSVSWLLVAGCDPSKDQPSGDSEPRGESAEPVVQDSGPSSTETAVDTEPSPGAPLSFVVILTDDMRADALSWMVNVQERLQGPGVTFTQAYVNSPMCCPARASLLSGGFLAQETGVLSNRSPNGSVHRFVAEGSMAVQFQQAGYATGLVGKYLNEYEDVAPAVPPGWNTFRVTLQDLDWFSFPVVEGSSAEVATTGATRTESTYLTDYIHNQSLAFLQGLDEDQPFLLWVNHIAPHHPGTPSEEFEGTLEGEVWRGGAFGEDDISDKPQCVQDLDAYNEADIATWDRLYQAAMESLSSVDASVAGLLDQLESSGRLDDTVVIFTSDNGFLWGEHRAYNKGLAYQESVHVPLVVLAPGQAARTVDELVSVTTDLPATIAELAGVSTGSTGSSLAPLLAGESPDSWRDALLLEVWDMDTCADWSGLVTSDWKYVEYANGDVELYDLVADPTESSSLHDHADKTEVVDELSARLDPLRGLTAATEEVYVTVGEEASVPLVAMGGSGTYSWQLVEGTLPAGLELQEGGSIVGTAAVAEGRAVTLQVSDGGTYTYGGEERTVSKVVWVEASESGVEGEKAAASGTARLRWTDGGLRIVLPLTVPTQAEVRMALDPGFDLRLPGQLGTAVPEGVAVTVAEPPAGLLFLRVNGLRGQWAVEVPERPVSTP